MVKVKQLALSDAVEWLGDWHPLAEQLGSAEGLIELSSVSALLSCPPVQHVESLRHLLREYRDRILLRIELPAIEAAHGHGSRNEVRELVALDQQLGQDSRLERFANPSRRVGQAQLQKLRPLKDQRVVQRYLNAVENGQAQGWHTLVYGLTLAIYSLPLRQGLLGYAHQTMRSFIYLGARMLQLSERECRELFQEVCADITASVHVMGTSEMAEWKS